MDEMRTGDNLGTGGVNSHIGVQPSKGEGMSGKYDAGSSSGGSGSGGGTMQQAQQKAGEMADQARDKASDVADQASGMAEQARNKASDLADQARTRANDLMNQAENTQPVRMARENPLPALGIAFAVGFMLAGGSDSKSRRGGKSGGALSKAKQQIQGAVLGGISAAIAQELKNMVGMQGGAGGLMDSLMGNQSGGQGSQGGQNRQSGGAGGSML